MDLVSITFNTKDYPNKYVARMWSIVGEKYTTPVEPLRVAETLEEANELCRNVGMVKIGLHPNDDPVIVETWI